MRGYSRIDHAAVAAASKADPGVFKFVGIYPASDGGKGAALRIPRAQRMPAYEPAGTFEAYSAPHEDGGWAVWARYVGGLPKPAPRPSTMSYRVCDPGSGQDHVGVSIVTVVVAAECPRCGGPRGSATMHQFHEGGKWCAVDRWDNACGHVDTYASVLAEYRRRLAVLEEVQRKEAARAADAWPDEAGEYTEAVRLLHAAADQIIGYRAKQAARFLDMRGQHEAARRIQEELRTRPRMSARQAARFLTDLAAARAACTECEDGRIDYQARDGEFVSLRCQTCRKEVEPRA